MMTMVAAEAESGKLLRIAVPHFEVRLLLVMVYDGNECHVPL